MFVLHCTLCSSIFTSEGQWRTNLVWNKFSRISASKILSLQSKVDEEDALYWSQTKTGDYTVRSGYWFLQGNESLPKGFSFWKHLWKAKIFNKWKLFLWKIAHNILPTSENLVKRGINSNSVCKCCNQGPDTSNHIFRECSFAQLIWKTSLLGLNSNTNPTINLRDWVRNYLTLFFKQDNHNPLRQATFVITLWSLWATRNATIFRNEQANPVSTIEFGKVWMQRWLAVSLTERGNYRNLLSQQQLVGISLEMEKSMIWEMNE